MLRNLQIFPIIFALNVAWFWLGIWVPFYLLFTNYAGVGLIETFAYMTGFLLELPTGALTDLLGKRKTLFLVFIFQILGNVVMATSSSFAQILVAAFLLGVGGTLYSGTRDAFIYDTLLTLHRESEFEKTLAKFQRYALITMAVASAIGGYLYVWHPTLPFWAVAFVHLICLGLCFKLKEPPVDSEQFAWGTYWSQMKDGFKQLFHNTKIDRKWLWQLLLVGIFAKFLIEGLDPVLLLGFGVSEQVLGYLYAIVPLISAGGAFLYEKYVDKLPGKMMWWILTITLGVTVMLSPIIGMGLGVLFLLMRNVLYPTVEVLVSGVVNRAVASHHRATALSASNMLQTAPYILTAAGIGWFIDQTSPQVSVSILAALFLIAAMALYRLKIKPTA